MDMSKLADAIAFASFAHKEQVRRYDNSPYVFHPLNVAHILAAHGISDDDVLAGAVLHDVVEDCGVSIETIERRFGPKVAAIVFDLTKKDWPGNRAARSAAEASRLALVSEDAQNVKCADLIDNTATIVQYDPKFAKTYLPEKRDVLKGMTLVKPELRLTAERQLVQAFAALAVEELLHGDR